MAETVRHRYCARYFFDPADYFDVDLDGETPEDAQASKEAYDNAARSFHSRTVFHNGVNERVMFVNFKLIRYSEIVINPRFVGSRSSDQPASRERTDELNGQHREMLSAQYG
jgi:hypothetical protein